MADNELTTTGESSTAVAEQDQTEAEFQYAVTVADAGPGTKKVSVEIPEDRIKTKLTEQYKELRQQAAIPGFRVGHAPAKLVQKRFGDEVKDQVRRTLISESYEQAIAKNNLQVLGDPQFQNAEELKLPETGAFTYTFEVEVQPDIQLPNLDNIPVKKPKITVKDENVDQAMSNLREQQGALIPVEDRGVEEKDYITADVHVKLDGNVVAHQHDGQLIARPARIAGIEVPDFAQQMAGAKTGETRTVNAKAPEAHAEPSIRGRDVQIEISVKEIKRLELVEITPEFLEDLGFENEQELREALREQMVERINFDIQQAMREQVHTYLLANTAFELPAKLSAKQVDRTIQRRVFEMLSRGVAREQVESQIDLLRASAQEQAGRELKLFFILQKIGTDKNVDVSEGELNGRVALLAVQRGLRPEKLKQTMAKDGSLAELYTQLREQKAVDEVLLNARIEEVEVSPEQQAAQATGEATAQNELPAAESPAPEAPASDAPQA